MEGKPSAAMAGGGRRPGEVRRSWAHAPSNSDASPGSGVQSRPLLSDIWKQSDAA